ncbi:enoyl-CoA hydratase/isomerase family protein [Aurantiacibacter spongiae]|nr:enoyl-CoA hydratase-related protein [Aurantiacibacter spongiae]
MIETRLADTVATITLSRPKVGNAFDVSMASAFRAAVEGCADDPAVRCIVVTGAGRMFCVGGDIGAMAQAGGDRATMLEQLIEDLHAALFRLATMPKPLVVAVNGPAAGAGFSLALLGDVVMAGRSANFLAAYGDIGLSADGGMSWTLPRIVGLRTAQRLLLLNEKVGAEEALRLGIASKVVADDELMHETGTLASRLAGSSMTSLGAARRLLHESFQSDFATQLESEHASMVSAAGGVDHREGVAAFLARRKPQFSARPGSEGKGA